MGGVPQAPRLHLSHHPHSDLRLHALQAHCCVRLSPPFVSSPLPSLLSHVILITRPNFVLPLPRETGFLSVFFQAIDHCLLFTSLAKYKETGLVCSPSAPPPLPLRSPSSPPPLSFFYISFTSEQNAEPWLTIRNFVEFKDRGIVLMRGELLGYEPTSCFLSLLISYICYNHSLFITHQNRKYLSTYSIFMLCFLMYYC